MNESLSLTEIEARLAREEAEATKADRDINDANERYKNAIANASALKLLLRLARAHASGEQLPDVRRVSY